MPDRENFSFSAGELGILSTEELVEAGESFLNSDPNDIKFVGGNNKSRDDDEEEEEKKDDKKDDKKVPPKKKAETKEVVVPPKEISDDDVFTVMEKKADADDDEEEEEIQLGKKAPKKEGQKIAGQDEEIHNQEPEESVFSTIAKELVANGVFSPDQDEEGNEIDVEINSPEEFLERFQLETRKQAADVVERFLEKYGDDYKDMFENVFVKGIKPIDYLNRYTKIESIASLDLGVEDNQEKIVRELYRSEGRSAEYIDKKMLQHKNYNDLAEEAEEAKKVLIQKEQVAIQQEAQNKANEIARKSQIRNEYVNSMNKIISDKMKNKEFDGIPVDRKFGEQIYGYLTQVKWQTPDKQDLTDFDKDILDLSRPENHELKVKVAMLLQLAKEDPKLSKLAKKAVSKESNELFKGLRKQGSKAKESTTKEPEESTEKSGSWFK